jgi:molecular chaperone DnaK (HSP70)
MNTNIINVGIDLGTDNCCITYQDNIGRPYIICDNDNYKISSIIGILNDGIMIGNTISKDNIYDIPIINNLKRLIGYKADSIEAQQIAKNNNWKLVDNNDDIDIIINNNTYTLNNLILLVV